MDQLILPGFEQVVAPAPRSERDRFRLLPQVVAPDDEITRAYLRRLVASGAAPKGAEAYRYQLRATLRAAHRIKGRHVTLPQMFQDASLLGRALVDDIASDGQTQLSRWTLALRRSAIRSFACLMRPELLPCLEEEPTRIVDQALRGAAERVGVGYRLTGGAPRRRGGITPSSEEVRALIEATGRASGYLGPRNQAFFGILAATGSRVNALRLLDGTDCLVLPSGRVRLYLREKGKAERREIELNARAAMELRDYVREFNRHAAAHGWTGRVRLGEPGAFWRNGAGRRWGYEAVLATLRVGCAEAGVPCFKPHSLRRAFATEAASQLPRHVVAQAGGWRGLTRMETTTFIHASRRSWRNYAGLQIKGRRPTSRQRRQMRQLSLFVDAEPLGGRGRLDTESERFLEVFGAGRLAEGASRRSALRETSQLRSLARECRSRSQPLPLTLVFADLALIGQALREPRIQISRSTGRTRLRAVHRFIRIVGPRLGRIPAADVAALDALLPARPTSSWHSTGTVVAGVAGRRRSRGPTLDGVDLWRIVDAVAVRGVELHVRDRALVALMCFSGLRIEEALALRWEDVEKSLTPGGYYGFSAVVERRGRRLRLLLPEPSADAFERLREAVDRGGEELLGHVFRASRKSNRPLSYRAAREVLVRACRRAGLPPAESSDLRAGFAHWLRAQGLSEHEVAAVLGLARVRSVDRLLARHAALDAQRRVGEQLVE